MLIRFFRQLRFKFVKNGITVKYLMYALGEIILVVIGILIALQVNNWNEARKEQKELTIIKENLYDEFKDNRDVLADRIALIEKAQDHSQQVLNFMGASREVIDGVNMDSILVYALYYGNFNPPNSTIIELLQAGKLKLIEDKVLKKYIADWLQMLEDTDEDFKNQDLQANEFLMPYINNHISQRNIDFYGKYRATNSRSILIEDYFYDVLHDFRFENLMISNMAWNTIMLQHYRELDQLALTIIQYMEKDL